MATKVPDIVKEIKTYTVSGLLLIAAWLLLVPTFIGHLEDQRLTQHLAAYLVIKDALAARTTTAFFDVGESEWAPPKPKGFAIMKNVGGLGVFECEVKPHAEAGTASTAGLFQSWCKPLVVSSLERRNRLLPLQARLIKVPTSTDIVAYYSLDAPDANLPLSSYRLVLVKRSSVDSWRKSSEPFGVLPQDIRMPEETDPLLEVWESRSEFLKNHDVYIVRAGLAERLLRGVGGEGATLVDSLLRAVYGDEVEYIQARQPVGWSRTKELLRDNSGNVPQLQNLVIGAEPVQKLVQQYIYQEGTYDVAGIKVAISQVPWAITVVLLMISCVLTGKYSSLKHAKSNDITDDFGWIFLQGSPGRGLIVRVASVVLITLTTTVVVISIATTVAQFPYLEASSRLALSALLLAIVAFSWVSALIVYSQIRLSRRLMSTDLPAEAKKIDNDA